MEEEEKEPIIQLELTITEVNLLFQALGNRPFNEVFQLIGKINEQAGNQLTINPEMSLETSKTSSVDDDE
ncbi:MAG: hypothetical protein ACI85O_001443 [Saprospiraceae bacterium]|jgi:hypothetical protein